MKKILIILCLMTPIASFADSTMCVNNDAVSILLDPSIAGTDSSYNTAQSTWWAWFPYGTVRGISACLSSNYSKSMGGYVSKLEDTNPATGVTSRVVGGETNGMHCWCKMTHPAASLWVFRNTYSSDSVCALDCAHYCGGRVRDNSVMRGGLFGSVRN